MFFSFSFFRKIVSYFHCLLGEFLDLIIWFTGSLFICTYPIFILHIARFIIIWIFSIFKISTLFFLYNLFLVIVLHLFMQISSLISPQRRLDKIFFCPFQCFYFNWYMLFSIFCFLLVRYTDIFIVIFHNGCIYFFC